MRTETFQLSPASAATLACYLHEPSPEMPGAEVRPAVLVLPGGGYTMCSDREAEPIALAYMAQGFHAFVSRYTVGGEHAFADALSDARAALERIRARAADWGVDGARVAVIGFSAGGHLAAALATEPGDRPDALILGYPCILRAIGETLAFPIPDAAERVDAGTPPTFVFSTADDRRVPIENSLAFMAALAGAGVPFEAHIFESGAHGLSLARSDLAGGNPEMVNETFAQWFGLSVDWLLRRLGPVGGAPKGIAG